MRWYIYIEPPSQFSTTVIELYLDEIGFSQNDDKPYCTYLTASFYRI
ncbi:hypothetical protein N5E66_07480 [Acinetobacter johnsonii]|nr:hypothetical protein [Acinetobacter johnsonii]MDH1488040.1 hypothetical protein [Acinetobacter johnsonii]MDH1613972.1 hypothetical protein [Acinetobacter johnsonii]